MHLTSTPQLSVKYSFSDSTAWILKFSDTRDQLKYFYWVIQGEIKNFKKQITYRNLRDKWLITDTYTIS